MSDPDRGEQGPGSPPLTARAPRATLVAFVVLVTVAVPYYVLRARAQWFFQDEWVFLVERDGGDLSDLFTPHGQHWSTLPILAYRVLWNLVGLHRYEPYQLLAVGAHLAVAVLLRVVMRRGGVGPWIATAAAGLFVLLGSGSQHIVWGFGVTFSASLALGIGHLLLADHDQRWGRRDLAGLACGLGSLMSSGVGITMLFVVGVATFLRRGWRHAAFHTAPLASIYGIWWYVMGRDRGVLGRDAPTADVARFLVRGVSNLFAELGQVRLVGWLLFGVLLTGLALAAREGSAFLRGRGAAPIAMALGALVFLATTGRGRVEEYGVEFATASRYVHVTAALVLPAVALAADTLVRRWRWLALPALVVLLVGVPGNVQTLETRTGPSPRLVLALAHDPALASAPRSLRPFARFLRPMVTREWSRSAQRISAGWLRDEADAGRIPELAGLPAEVEAEATALLALDVDPYASHPECTSGATAPRCDSWRRGSRCRSWARSRSRPWSMVWSRTGASW